MVLHAIVCMGRTISRLTVRHYVDVYTSLMRMRSFAAAKQCYQVLAFAFALPCSRSDSGSYFCLNTAA
jgi:hypothetical protein